MCPEGPELCKITARGIRTFPAPPCMSRCPRGRLGERSRSRRGDRANRSLYTPMRIPELLLACSARRRIGFENHFSHKLSAYVKAQLLQRFATPGTLAVYLNQARYGTFLAHAEHCSFP